MPNIILDLLVDRVDLVDEGANSAAFIKLYKRKENDESMLTFDEILAKMKPEHAEVIRTEVTKAKAEIPAETATELETVSKAKQTAEEQLKLAQDQLQDIEVAKGKDAQPDFEEVMKSLDPALQEVFKSLKTQKEAAEQVAREAAQKELDTIAKSRASELKSLPVEEAQLVTILKSATPEIIDVLKAANKAIEDGGLFEEVGKSKSGAAAASADDAWTKIEKKADEIADAEKVSKQKAISLAIKQNPDLYREYLKGGAN